MAVSILYEEKEEEDDKLTTDKLPFFPTARLMHVCQLAGTNRLRSSRSTCTTTSPVTMQHGKQAGNKTDAATHN